MAPRSTPKYRQTYHYLVKEKAARKETVRSVQRQLNRFNRFVQDTLHKCRASPQLLHAPAAAGKTTTVVRSAPYIHPATYFTLRDDLKRQAQKIAEQEGHSTATLPSALKHCPAFDQSSSTYEPEAVELWKNGVAPSLIHDELDLHPELGVCEYEHRYDAIDTNSEDIDLLIGDPLHAHLDAPTENRLVVFDELPLRRLTTTFEDAPQQVTDWLKSDPHPKFLPDDLSDWSDVLRLQGTDRGDAVAEMLRGLWSVSRDEIKDANPRYHRNSPLFLYTVLAGEPLGNTCSVAQLGFNRLVFDRTTKDIILYERPHLHESWGVIGLDATPRTALWNLLLPPKTEFERRTLFDLGSREWDIYHHHPQFLHLDLQQLGTSVKPYDGGGQTLKRDEAVLRYVAEREGAKSDLITTQAAIRKYRKAGLLDLTSDHLNYRSVRSSNRFAGSDHTVGVLQGSPHPGDDVIKRWCALLGKPTTITGNGTSKNYGGTVQNAVARHFTHDVVYHAVMRFARGDAPATVYVNTTAVDEWLSSDCSLLDEFADNWQSYAGVEPVIKTHLRQHGDSTITDLAKAINYSKSRVREGVNELDADSDSPIERRDRPGAKPDKVVWNE